MYDIEQDVENVDLALYSVFLEYHGNMRDTDEELCRELAIAALSASTAVKELKELQERYDSLVKENDWQPISQAPKDVVIITCGDVPKFARISYFDTSINQWNYYPYGSGKHKVEPPYWWRELDSLNMPFEASVLKTPPKKD